VGCTQLYGEAGAMNVTRGATFLAGLPETVPSTVVNRFCASSLQAIRMAFHAIKAGEGETYLCGGVESVTRCLPGGGGGGAHPRFVGQRPLAEIYVSMGMTAENVADRYGISREEMDQFAQQSQERAVAAQRDGTFDREIVPYAKPDGTLVKADDGPRPG